MSIKKAGVSRLLSILCINLLYLFVVEHEVGEDAEDECTCNLSDGDLTEGNAHAADTCYEDYGNNEEVAVLVEINVLNHLKTGDSDEAVECYANPTHYTGRNGCKEGCERSEERDYNCQDCGCKDGNNGSVAGNCNTADGFAVSCVGAAAEDGACYGTDTVTEKGAVQAGLLEEVDADDGRKVLVVCDVLCEYNECNRNICNSNSCYVGCVHFGEALCCLEEGKVGNPGNALEEAEVDYLKCFIAGAVADEGEYGCYCVACEYADDERNHLEHLLAVDGAQHGNCQSYEAADNAYIGRCGCCRCAGQVADCVACKGKTDDSNSGSDNDCGHNLVDPAYAACFNYDCNNNIYKACECCAEDEACITCLKAYSTCECSCHGTEECEGRTEEYGALKLGEQQVNDSADACTKECCGLGHAVADNCRNCDSCCHDCQQLLQCKQYYLAKLRPVADVVSKVHNFILSISLYKFILAPLNKHRFLRQTQEV